MQYLVFLLKMQKQICTTFSVCIHIGMSEYQYSRFSVIIWGEDNRKSGSGRTRYRGTNFILQIYVLFNFSSFFPSFFFFFFFFCLFMAAPHVYPPLVDTGRVLATVLLSKPFAFSEPQFLHLYNGSNYCLQD